MQSMSTRVTEIMPALDKVPDVVSGVVRELESRAIGAGTVTREWPPGAP